YGPQLNRVGFVDILTFQAADHLDRILVRVDHDAWSGLRRLVQAVCVRIADFNPRAKSTGQIADGDGGLVGQRKPHAGLHTRLRLQRVRENPREQVLLGLRRVTRHPKTQRLVNAAVVVSEIDVEVVDRRRQRHWRYWTGVATGLPFSMK